MCLWVRMRAEMKKGRLQISWAREMKIAETLDSRKAAVWHLKWHLVVAAMAAVAADAAPLLLPVWQKHLCFDEHAGPLAVVYVANLINLPFSSVSKFIYVAASKLVLADFSEIIYTRVERKEKIFFFEIFKSTLLGFLTSANFLSQIFKAWRK